MFTATRAGSDRRPALAAVRDALREAAAVRPGRADHLSLLKRQVSTTSPSCITRTRTENVPCQRSLAAPHVPSIETRIRAA